MAKIKTRNISELKPDQQNINDGSEFGMSLLEKSIRETGLGRSVVTDKNDVLIAGNKTYEAAGQLGIEKVVEVETDGTELVVVKRMDLDINTTKGIRHKILDNTVSKHNYRENAEVVASLMEPAEIMNLNEYGLSSVNVEEGDDVNFKANPFAIKIVLSSEQEFEYALKDIGYLMRQKYPQAVIKAKGTP